MEYSQGGYIGSVTIAGWGYDVMQFLMGGFATMVHEDLRIGASLVLINKMVMSFGFNARCEGPKNIITERTVL